MPRLERFTDRVAFVTGAGSGIGRATAERLAAEGARVAVVDVDEEASELVVEGIQTSGGTAQSFVLDVADRAKFEHVARSVRELLGPISLLVNNAAVGGSGRLSAWDEKVISRAFEVNVKGVMNGLGVVGETMREGEGGAVVNIASLAGILGLIGLAPYTMTKGAVVALTRAAAMELAPNVRVNAIAPGKIITPFREKMFGVPLSESELAEMRASYPLQRVGSPDDVAGCVAFLGSDDAAFITGVILPVDGGKTAGLHNNAI